ncbi:MAG: DUF882 domain-containing protein, partial [Bradyrhizobium sp.]|nr:DUF882 domain-containing protein [Bradyrhizobium sp.]
QVRTAGLRLQRGGVGFYPTSGSPFVHLDTGSVRHWPRMNADQLARVFPDGRTVHVPSNGKPLKGYELALADIEKRGGGDDVSSGGKPGLFAALFGSKSFGSKSNDEEDEGASAPAVRGKASPASVMASAAPAKSADPVPMPRAKPVASTFQLASADARIVHPARPKQAASADKSEAKPQTPADIINARGFWDAAPKQATAAQIAAISARNAVNSADPQSTASVSEAFKKALAYAPAASSPVDRANIVAASAPIPRGARPSPRNAMAAMTIDTVVAKGQQGQASVVATATRMAASKGNDVWMRVMILAPSASTSMSATVLGDSDMTLMRAHFVKPQAVIAMSFSEDPQLGLTCDRFTGSATARLATQSFVMRTAALR